MDLQSLLRSRNKCLRRFLELSSRFLRSEQSISDDSTDLIEFQSQRSGLLKAYGLYDQKVTELVEATPNLKTDEKLIGAVIDSMAEKKQLIAEISRVDEAIMNRIQSASEEVMSTISGENKKKSVLRRFKSTWIPESGEGLDKKA